MYLFRYKDGLVPNCCAISYILVAYPLSLWGLAEFHDIGYLLCCLLLTHSLIIASYLLHECMHHTIFRNSDNNRRLGMLLAWMTGALYVPYHILQNKHLMHHASRADIFTLDYRSILANRPLLRRFTQSMQWNHLPAVEILTHILSMAAPFVLPERSDQSAYVIIIICSRIVFFLLLAPVSITILPGYLIAYLAFIWVLAFMDSTQHHYDMRMGTFNDKSTPKHGRDYEETHTFSNLLSRRLPWLNLLVLNFCYHNVHHYRSGEPWYRLPRLHDQRYSGREAPVIGMTEQIRLYDSYRVDRVMSNTKIDGGPGIGAAGVSFLVGV